MVTRPLYGRTSCRSESDRRKFVITSERSSLEESWSRSAVKPFQLPAGTNLLPSLTRTEKPLAVLTRSGRPSPFMSVTSRSSFACDQTHDVPAEAVMPASRWVERLKSIDHSEVWPRRVVLSNERDS